MKDVHPLPRGTHVEFDTTEGLAVGTAVVLDAEYDDGWLYRLDVTGGDAAAVHRNQRGELWACEFEVRRCETSKPRRQNHD